MVPCTCAYCKTQLPFKYLEFIPLNTIINQLLYLDDKELTILLSNGSLLAANIICHILKADLAQDGITNLTNNNKQDPLIVHHVQHLKY